MSAQSIAPRSRPASTVDTDDAMMARAIEFAAWARNNRRLVIGGAVIAALLIGGLLYYRMHQANRMEQAAAEFMQVEQTLGSGNTQLAQRDLQRFVQRFGGTTYALEAQLILGRLLLEEGKPQEAVAQLRPVADDVDTPLGASAALLLAAAHQAAGDQEAAVNTYLRLADGAELQYQREEALQSAAVLREQAGDFAGAAELYRRLVELSEEGSLPRSIYEMRLAEVTARAGAK